MATAKKGKVFFKRGKKFTPQQIKIAQAKKERKKK
jgi:hypothetical protein